MASERKRWGGARKGAGRKPGVTRRNRVVILLTDKEHEQLIELAKRDGVQIGTKAREIVARSVSRSK
jgi:hypothetical protein